MVFISSKMLKMILANAPFQTSINGIIGALKESGHKLEPEKPNQKKDYSKMPFVPASYDVSGIEGADEPNYRYPETQEGEHKTQEINLGIQKAIANAYKRYPELPRGWLEALVMMESFNTKNREHEKEDEGRFGWLTGFTIPTADNIRGFKQRGDPRYKKIFFNFDTPANAIMSSASWADFLRKEWKDERTIKGYVEDPIDLYDLHWKTEEGADTRKQFEHHFNIYSKTYEE
jgi:hypothetical protein